MTEDDRVKRSTLVVAVMATIIATVLALEFYGLIDHNPDKSAYPVGEFKAIFLKPGEQHRFSTKPPQLHAECQDGFLVIASNVDPNMRGALVDHKNRNILCQRPKKATPTEPQEQSGE